MVACQRPQARAGANIKEWLDKGATVVDVRSLPEFQSGHFPQARHIPHDQIDLRLAELPDKEAPIVLYCASGVRSAQALRILQQNGYQAVLDAGGLRNMPL